MVVAPEPQATLATLDPNGLERRIAQNHGPFPPGRASTAVGQPGHLPRPLRRAVGEQPRGECCLGQPRGALRSQASAAIAWPPRAESATFARRRRGLRGPGRTRLFGRSRWFEGAEYQSSTPRTKRARPRLSRQGGPCPNRTSAGSRSASRRAESRLRPGVKEAGGSWSPGDSGQGMAPEEDVAEDERPVTLAPQRDGRRSGRERRGPRSPRPRRPRAGGGRPGAADRRRLAPRAG